MNTTQKSYAQLHIAVLLYGFTAILGDLITLSAIQLVWWRVLITSISLLFFVQFGASILRIDKKILWPLVGIGWIVALHWICFYGSIKLANASIALICMATTSIFTSFIEPIVFRKKVDVLEIILGAMIIPGMIIVVQSVDISMFNGILVGIASAFLASLFGTLNKKYVDHVSPYELTFVELSSAWVFISLIFIFGYGYFDFSNFIPSSVEDWIYIILLALLCTTLAYILALKALKHLSAFATNLVVNLEPLYGILLAAIILKEYEQLNTNFYIGGGIIIAVVLSYPSLKKRFGTND